MPIARDFFSTFEQLEISENPWVLIDGLLDYIMHVKGENPGDFLRRNIDIEELYTEIEENLNLYKGKDAHYRQNKGIQIIHATSVYIFRCHQRNSERASFQTSLPTGKAS